MRSATDLASRLESDRVEDLTLPLQVRNRRLETARLFDQALGVQRTCKAGEPFHDLVETGCISVCYSSHDYSSSSIQPSSTPPRGVRNRLIRDQVERAAYLNSAKGQSLESHAEMAVHTTASISARLSLTHELTYASVGPSSSG